MRGPCLSPVVPRPSVDLPRHAVEEVDVVAVPRHLPRAAASLAMMTTTTDTMPTRTTTDLGDDVEVRRLVVDVPVVVVLPVVADRSSRTVGGSSSPRRSLGVWRLFAIVCLTLKPSRMLPYPP